MKYSNVYISSFGYELAPNIITTEAIEKKLEPFFKTMNFGPGLIEALTGIKQRRFWDEDHTLSQHAANAGQKAIDNAQIQPDEIEMLIFCGVGQDGFEPATSCAVADALKVSEHCQVFDVKNACLGLLNAMVHVANAIELGQIRCGLVVTCETARQIVESTIDEINQHKDIEFYRQAVATLTGGSGAVAVLLTDGTIGSPGLRHHKLMGGVMKNNIQHHGLCSWGFEHNGMPTNSKVIMRTDAQGVLEHGLDLVHRSYNEFKVKFQLENQPVDRFIGHQVGSLHHQKFYEALGEDMAKDFATFPFLGNMGTAALPTTAAIADERNVIKKEDLVVFIGVGSGLNCIILGIEW